MEMDIYRWEEMLHHMATILLWYCGHFESTIAAKIQKSSDLAKVWFPSRLWCYELISIVWFAIAAILIPKWPPKYKNPPILAKFGFQVDFALAIWYLSSFLELGGISRSFTSYYILLLFLLFHFPHQFCPSIFSEMPSWNFMKPCRNIICHVKLCF